MLKRAAAFVGFLVVVLAALITLGAWAISSPSGSSPDDDFHLASAWCISDAGSQECTLVAEGRGYSVYRLNDFPVACYQFQPEVSGTCSELASPEWRVNENLYPPLFYEYSAQFAGDDATQFHVRTRLAVVVSVVAILAAAYLVSLPWLRPAMLVSWVAVAAPGLMSWVASNNPSAWGIVGLAAAWGPMTTAYLAASRSRQISASAIWLAAVAMAAGARGDTGLYAAVMAVVGVGLFMFLPIRGGVSVNTRIRRSWPGLASSVLVVGLVAVLVGGTEQAGMASGGFWEGDQASSSDAVVWSLVLGLPGLVTGLWGAPGGVGSGGAGVFSWYDTAMPPGAWIPALLAVGGLLLLGAGMMFLRKALAVLVVLLVIVAVPSRALLQDGAIVGELFQARYLAPLVVVLVGLMLIPSSTARVHVNWSQASILAFALAAAGTLGLHTWLRRFVTGTDVLSVDLTQGAEWWQFSSTSPNQVWLVGSAAWLILVATAVRALLTPTPVEQNHALPQEAQ